MKAALFILAVCLLGPACLTVSTQAKQVRSLKEEVARRFQRREGDDDNDSGNNNIPELIQELGLTTLLDLAVKADLASVLSGPGPLTVFAPTNGAFDELPESFFEFIAKPENLKFILSFHVLLEDVPSGDLENELLLDTALDIAQLRINVYDKDDGTVVTAQCVPIELDNVDHTASNGLVHVIDSVLIPPMIDLLGYICIRPDLSTFATAVKAVELLEEDSDAFTVFVPSDQAFLNLPPGLLETLLNDTEALKTVLEYHIVDGTYCSVGLSSGTVSTLLDENISIDASSDGVTVNGARVTEADTTVTNGVIHVIDKVLIPPSLAKELNP